jgi:serine/threonine protein kinase
VFGSYRVTDEIGAGRFGPVYRAEDQSYTHVTEATGGNVAIKVFDQGLSAEQAETLARALTRLCDAPLDHPSIVAPIGAGLNGRSAWLAEPYVDATPLDATLKGRGRLPLSDVLLRVTQVAGALDFAAATGVYHGALHPRDILFAGDRTLVTGLGIAQALAEANLDIPASAVSPQHTVNGTVTRSDDIRALAAITFEALYGRPLADPSRLASLVTPLSGVDHALLREVLQHSLGENPAERPQTALEFAKALQVCMSNPEPVMEEAPPDSHADSALIAPIPLPIPVDDLPLRTSTFEAMAKPEFEPGSVFQAESPHVNPNLIHNRGVLNPNSNADSEPRSVWLAMAAMLVAGLVMGFVAGFIVAQRELTPPPRTAERAVPRAQREAAPEPVPTPTVGQDFTESSVEGRAPETGPSESKVGREDSGVAERTSEAEPNTPGPGADVQRADSNALRPDPDALRPDSTSMEVVSRPAGAEVFVDGRMVGRTPLVLPGVSPGDHSVRIALPGHQRWATTVNVAAGSRARVAASLER